MNKKRAKKVSKPPSAPLRTDAHRIDTLAVRKVLSKLSPDWIVRDLSERDYGIDLMLEYYSNDKPTGQLVLFQVKGTSGAVNFRGDVVKFQMQKHTLLYAERFPEPFFLVHTSTQIDTPIYFVWLQKYVTHRLDRNAAQWRVESEESININIPVTNTFDGAESKLINISRENVLTREIMQFLSTYLFWELDYSELLAGNESLAHACAKHVKRMKSLTQLIENYQMGLPNLDEAVYFLESYDTSDDAGKELLNELNHHLGVIRTDVLTRHHSEEFAEEILGELPY
jgi:hypothetical protein